eukprot:c24378_g1_i1 orf=91-597(+)
MVWQRWAKAQDARSACPFCVLSHGLPQGDATALLYTDDKIVAFQDRDPSAYRLIFPVSLVLPIDRHYLIVPVEHIPSVNSLQKGEEHHSLVEHMLNTGRILLQRDASGAIFRFGFHRPPLNSVDHLHLHCMALPFNSRWRALRYTALSGWGGFVDVNYILQRLDPRSL